MHKLLSLLIIIPLLLACGGGGGSSEFVGAATVSIEVAPKKIDTGDRMLVKISIKDVNENGIILKIKFPESLAYVLDSAILKIKEEMSIDASFYVNSDGDNYLVFFLAQSLFEDQEDGELSFELEGISIIEKGKVGVDADVDDPLIDNESEFDVDQPEFLAEDEVEIKVEG